MDYFAPRYSSADACKAARIMPATLKNWLSRKPAVLLLSDNERRAVGNRTEFCFSLARVLQLAIIAALVDNGLQPRHAGTMAMAFTDAEEGALPGKPSRKICELFPRGKTVLISTFFECGEIVNIDSRTTAYSLFDNFIDGAVVLELNSVVERVYEALGIAA